MLLPKIYILTGGPGSGKTTAIEILASRDYYVMPEVAREILDEEQKKNSDALPWKDPAKFQNMVADRQNEREKTLKTTEVFFDRGLVDGYAYCKYFNIPIPKIIMDNGENRYNKVFLFEQLPMYQKDDNRKEDKKSADLIHKLIKEAYIKFGYDVIDVPVLPPEKRVDFIISKL